MPHFVEDAGDPLSAGWLSRRISFIWRNNGIEAVGEEEVEWTLLENGMRVTQPQFGQTGQVVQYTIQMMLTKMPQGGERWWKCPVCSSRVNDLYLVADRDRLACRKCCKLVYQSRYTPQKPKRRRKRAQQSHRLPSLLAH
ncbi:MAG: hypothetical protein C0467_30210 [Planctomycetaceae bacterium]|nr:hypothetical protein [Planctomycetaceae bacterium]